jgi:riboflavin biosynthesis pyrimidine reductase
MGGADVIGQFLDAGLVDSIEIFVMPILLGNGILTFPRDRSGSGPALELTDSTRFDSGVVRLLYTAK